MLTAHPLRYTIQASMVPDWTPWRELCFGGGCWSPTLACISRLHRIGLNLALGATMQDRCNHHVRLWSWRPCGVLRVDECASILNGATSPFSLASLPTSGMPRRLGSPPRDLSNFIQASACEDFR